MLARGAMNNMKTPGLLYRSWRCLKPLHLMMLRSQKWGVYSFVEFHLCLGRIQKSYFFILLHMIGQWAEIIEDGGKSKLSRVPRFNWFPATATASCLLFSCSWICLLSPMRELHFLTSICAMNWWCAVEKWKMCDKKVEDTTSCGFETIFGISTPIPGELFCNLTCALFFFLKWVGSTTNKWSAWKAEPQILVGLVHSYDVTKVGQQGRGGEEKWTEKNT